MWRKKRQLPLWQNQQPTGGFHPRKQALFLRLSFPLAFIWDILNPCVTRSHHMGIRWAFETKTQRDRGSAEPWFGPHICVCVWVCLCLIYVWMRQSVCWREHRPRWFWSGYSLGDSYLRIKEEICLFTTWSSGLWRHWILPVGSKLLFVLSFYLLKIPYKDNATLLSSRLNIILHFNFRIL